MLNSLNQVLAEVINRAIAGPVFLWLDFDGTLAPIAAEPSETRLDESIRRTLITMRGMRQVTIGVISGRALEDLHARVDVPSIFYAGNHGLEILGPGLRFADSTALATMDELQQVIKQLVVSLWPISGVRVEDKRLTATVHYRLVADSHIPEIRWAVEEAVSPYAARFDVRQGKESFEILPRTPWNKGTAVRWINRLQGIPSRSAIYIGDDASDEDVFEALTDGVTIKVGSNGQTSAKYLLSGPDEVQELLTSVARQLAPGRRP